MRKTGRHPFFHFPELNFCRNNQKNKISKCSTWLCPPSHLATSSPLVLVMISALTTSALLPAASHCSCSAGSSTTDIFITASPVPGSLLLWPPRASDRSCTEDKCIWCPAVTTETTPVNVPIATAEHMNSHTLCVIAARKGCQKSSIWTRGKMISLCLLIKAANTPPKASPCQYKIWSIGKGWTKMLSPHPWGTNNPLCALPSDSVFTTLFLQTTRENSNPSHS